jgi:hypothetical protein
MICGSGQYVGLYPEFAVVPARPEIEPNLAHRNFANHSKRWRIAYAGCSRLHLQMLKRACYIHVGPHKTGTTSIQVFLKEHRAELLRHGYFVPESGNVHGGHHPLVMQLCGQEVPERHKSAAASFSSAVKDTTCDAVVISSEVLDGLLRNRHLARKFFNRIEELNLEPTLVFFPRNQSQWMNSRYTEVVKKFRRCEPFEAFVKVETPHPCFRFSDLTALAKAFNAKLISHPFTRETITRGVVPEFLRAIGIDPLQFQNTNTRCNQLAGPFTVSVARDVLRSMGSSSRELTWLQTSRCGRILTAYLVEKGLADSGYCGLTTALARHIETEFQPGNDAFAQQVWGRPWAEVFATDFCRDFTPNDFEISPPGWAIRRRLRRAVREMKAMMQEILLDPTLAVEAPWNDLRKRSG